MNLTAKQVFGKIHLWLGLASGLVIFIVALTGALYVFSDDIIQVTESSYRNITPVNTEQLPSSQLLDIANKETFKFLKGDLPKWDWQIMYRFSDKTKAVEFTSRHYNEPNLVIDLFIDPYTGKVLCIRDHFSNAFWDTVVELHTNLCLGDVGKFMVDFATLFLVVMLVTGIVLWWPKSKKGLKQRFTFKWKPSFTWKRKNYDLHNVLGFYACWVVLFMAITGLTWAFGWVSGSMAFMLGGVKEREEIVIKNPYQEKLDNNSINLIYDTVRKMDPGAYCYHLNLARDSAKPFDVYAKQTKVWAPGNTYYFNQSTGAFLSSKKYSDLSAAEKYSELTGDIHYGWIFGWPSKIATFFACLVVASLPITGFLIWWGRKKKSKNVNANNVRQPLDRYAAI